mgnify:CR=1 FL=1
MHDQAERRRPGRRLGHPHQGVEVGGHGRNEGGLRFGARRGSDRSWPAAGRTRGVPRRRAGSSQARQAVGVGEGDGAEEAVGGLEPHGGGQRRVVGAAGAAVGVTMPRALAGQPEVSLTTADLRRQRGPRRGSPEAAIQLQSSGPRRPGAVRRARSPAAPAPRRPADLPPRAWPRSSGRATRSQRAEARGGEEGGGPLGAMQADQRARGLPAAAEEGRAGGARPGAATSARLGGAVPATTRVAPGARSASASKAWRMGSWWGQASQLSDTKPLAFQMRGSDGRHHIRSVQPGRRPSPAGRGRIARQAARASPRSPALEQPGF